MLLCHLPKPENCNVILLFPVYHKIRQLCCGNGMFLLMQWNAFMSVVVMSVLWSVWGSVLVSHGWLQEVGTHTSKSGQQVRLTLLTSDISRSDSSSVRHGKNTVNECKILGF